MRNPELEIYTQDLRPFQELAYAEARYTQAMAQLGECAYIRELRARWNRLLTECGALLDYEVRLHLDELSDDEFQEYEFFGFKVLVHSDDNACIVDYCNGIDAVCWFESLEIEMPDARQLLLPVF